MMLVTIPLFDGQNRIQLGGLYKKKKSMMTRYLLPICVLIGLLLPLRPSLAQEAPRPGRVCVSAPPMQLVLGAQAIVQDSNNNAPLNLRDEPSTYGAKIGELPRRTVVTVIEGPLCGRANNLFAWWRVETADGLSGWAAEGDSSRTQDQYFLAPLDHSNIDPDGVNCGAAPVSMVSLGTFAAVSESAGADLVLREEPSGRIIDFLNFGSLMTVIDGPRCGTNQRLFKWWKVATEDGLIGWVAEGDSTQNPARYFLRPATPQEVNAATLRTPLDLGCPASPPSILQVGDVAQVNPTRELPLNLRSSPGGQSMGTLAEGTKLEVLAGAQCANLYAWWEVRTEDGRRGWVAEGDKTQTPIAYFISLYQAAGAPATPPPSTAQPTTTTTCTDTQPARVKVGELAIVTSPTLALRLGSSVGADVLLALPQGTRMIVLNGPRCGDGTQLYTWWQVRNAEGAIGWVQESDTATYYIEPVLD